MPKWLFWGGILGMPGYAHHSEPPQHSHTWVQFRTIIKEHREDGTWLLQLVSSENTSIGNPFTAAKPALYKTQEEANAALSARLAGLRDR